MKLILSGLAVLTMTTATFAGGIDRSGQSVDFLFESGRYAELSFGSLTPQVSGTFMHPVFGALPSGNVGPATGFVVAGLAFKTDLGAKFSLGVNVDEPFGAEVDYTKPGYPLYGTSAHVKTTGVTLLGRYKINDAFSIHGGLESITASGDVTLSTVPYSSTYSNGSDVAYVLGVAYEKPESGLRLAVTYTSATTFNLKGTTGNAKAEMPQSINVDFQTDISPNTQLMASARWAQWSKSSITDSLVGSLLSYSKDSVSYAIGVDHHFNETWSGMASFGYEAPHGGLSSNLEPYDGYSAISLGGTFTKGAMKISGGVSYRMLGDATTEKLGAQFSGNSAVIVGMKIAYAF